MIKKAFYFLLLIQNILSFSGVAGCLTPDELRLRLFHLIDDPVASGLYFKDLRRKNEIPLPKDTDDLILNWANPNKKINEFLVAKEIPQTQKNRAVIFEHLVDHLRENPEFVSLVHAFLRLNGQWDELLKQIDKPLMSELLDLLSADEVASIIRGDSVFEGNSLKSAEIIPFLSRLGAFKTVALKNPFDLLAQVAPKLNRLELTLDQLPQINVTSFHGRKLKVKIIKKNPNDKIVKEDIEKLRSISNLLIVDLDLSGLEIPAHLLKDLLKFPIMKNVRSLNLAFNKLGEGPLIPIPFFKKRINVGEMISDSLYLKNLVYLDLQLNFLRHADYEMLSRANLPYLRGISLRTNLLDENSVDFLLKSKWIHGLFFMDLAATLLNERALRRLISSYHVRELRGLRLSNNGILNLNAVLSPNHLNHLWFLDLGHNSLNGDAVRPLIATNLFPNLTDLNFSENNIGVEGVRYFAQAPESQRFHFISFNQSMRFYNDEIQVIINESPYLSEATKIGFSSPTMTQPWAPSLE